jgi:hypothetical protein
LVGRRRKAEKRKVVGMKKVLGRVVVGRSLLQLTVQTVRWAGKRKLPGTSLMVENSLAK